MTGTVVFFALAVGVGEAETVELEGMVDAEQAGMVRVELLTPQAPGQNPLLAWTGWVQAPGAFSFEVPVNLGHVKLRAALDLKRDGIGPDDPQMRVPIPLLITEAPIRDLEIRIRPPEHRSPALPAPSPEGLRKGVQ